MCEDTRGKTALKFPSYSISLSLLCIVKYNIIFKVKRIGVSLCMKTVLLLYSLVQDP